MAEHVQTLTRHESSGAGENPLGIKGVDHIEFFVDDTATWADWHENRLGMYRRAAGDPSTGLKGRKAIICGQGRGEFFFAQPAGGFPEGRGITEHFPKDRNRVGGG